MQGTSLDLRTLPALLSLVLASSRTRAALFMHAIAGKLDFQAVRLGCMAAWKMSVHRTMVWGY